MERFERCRERRAAFVAVVLVTLGASAFASPARADDDVPGLPAAVDAILVAAEAAGAAEGGEATEATDVVEAAATELDSPSVVPAPAASADTTADSADISADTEADVDTGEPAVDTGELATETTSDAAAPPSSAPNPAPPAVQTAPRNVNVSVRVDSPGDAGPVTQLNVAVGEAASGSAPATKASDASAATEAAAPKPVFATGSADESTSGSALISAEKDAKPNWSWNWDCVSRSSATAVSSLLSEPGSMPANWTWNWNCPDNNDNREPDVAQYRGAIAIQYHPVNVNVSIRVSSPGNDGPVTQANVAMTVSSGGVAPPRSPGGGASVDARPHVPDAEDEDDHDPTPPLLEITFRWDTTSEDIVLTDPAALASAEAEAEGELRLRRGLLPFSALTELAPEGGRLVLPGLVTRPTLPALQDLTRRRAGVASPVGRPGPEPHASSTRAKTQPRWTAPRRPPLPVDSVPAGASVAASSGGGSSSGGLPIFLALPFLAAMLDLARRGALSRATWPPGHRGRVPETPG